MVRWKSSLDWYPCKVVGVNDPWGPDRLQYNQGWNMNNVTYKVERDAKHFQSYLDGVTWDACPMGHIRPGNWRFGIHGPHSAPLEPFLTMEKALVKAGFPKIAPQEHSQFGRTTIKSDTYVTVRSGTPKFSESDQIVTCNLENHSTASRLNNMRGVIVSTKRAYRNRNMWTIELLPDNSTRAKIVTIREHYLRPYNREEESVILHEDNISHFN